MKHLLKLSDLSRDEIDRLIAEAIRMKRERASGIVGARPLDGKTLGLLFHKSSTRTRVSFEVGAYQLGASAIYLDASATQIGRGETVADTARVLSRYLDGLAVRCYAHEDLEELAAHADIPVINALTDRYHPCQLLADLMTIKERFGSLDGIKAAYIGDGNNMAHSWMLAAAITGIDLTVAAPMGYRPEAGVIEETARLAQASGAVIDIVDDPKAAAEGAHVLYTDVWVSMGQDAEAAERLRAFQGYQIDQRLVDMAHADAIVMHCLPAHRGQEISAEVMDGPRSVVWDEAENRLHAQKAVLQSLMAPSVGGATLTR
jgi:ornithine carbamoyltransferase